MKTKITELLGIEYPIVQGAMAWIAEHHLAAAVSKGRPRSGHYRGRRGSGRLHP